MKIWKTMKQIKKLFEYVPPEDERREYSYQPKYDIHQDSSHTSVAFNHDREIVSVADKTPCYRCRKRPFSKVMNRRGYCSFCASLQEVTDAESERLENMRWYRVAHFISEGGEYFPFVRRDGVRYERLYAKYAHSNRVLRVIGLDGMIEAIAVADMSDLEWPQDRFVALDSVWIEDLDEDNRW